MSVHNVALPVPVQGMPLRTYMQHLHPDPRCNPNPTFTLTNDVSVDERAGRMSAHNDTRSAYTRRMPHALEVK